MKKFLYLPVICISLALASCSKNDTQQDLQGFSLNLQDDFSFYVLGEGNKIDQYSTANGDNSLSSVTVTGLQSSEKLLDIDFRPATGQLYALGSTGRLYFINLNSGAATMVGTGPLAGFNGTMVGFDFNPTVDRIRIVSNTGQNLRVNPENGVVIMDGSLNGVPGAVVTAVAYTNSFAGTSTTTLYDLDITTDKLYKQLPPNDGTLVEVGSLNNDLEGDGGFDISADGNMALAVYQSNKKTALFLVDLMTGKAKKLEKFSKGQTYYAIAIPTNPVAYAFSGSNFLIFNPTTNEMPVSKTITGLQAGESIVGMDFRPATSQIYAIGSNSRIYTMNTSNGTATYVATLSTMLSGTSFGVDFNPVADRIRVESNNGQNLRINPTDGFTIVDGSLNPGTPNVSAAAYTNSFAGTTSTMLYAIDVTANKLYLQNANAGTLSAIGDLGISITSDNGFDIGGSTNNAYGVFTTTAGTMLYSVNKSTGMATSVRSLPSAVGGFTIGLGF